MYNEDPRWAEVDGYFSDRFAPHDPALEQALAANAAAGLPAHDVSALQGKFLALLVMLSRAERILEIGGLGGYSTIWLARAAQPAGQVVSLELSPDFAKVAEQNIASAGVADRVRILVGPALDTLAELHRQSAEPFDFIFIDADKPNNPAYLEWALKLSRPGTVIVGDNVVRGGAVVDAHSTDPSVRGVRRFTEQLAATEGLFCTALQTVGMKGWDGMTISLVEG